MPIAAYAAIGIETTTHCSNGPHPGSYAAMGIETTNLRSDEPSGASQRAAKRNTRLAEVALLEFEAGRVKTAV
jgi:hypothetical protein